MVLGSSRGRPKGRNKVTKALLWAAVAVGIACISVGVAHATGIVNVTEIADTVPDLLQAEVEEDLNTDGAWGVTPNGVQCVGSSARVPSTIFVGGAPTEEELVEIRWCEDEYDRRVALQDEQRGPLLEIAARMDEMDYLLDDDPWDIFNTVYWCLGGGEGLNGPPLLQGANAQAPRPELWQQPGFQLRVVGAGGAVWASGRRRRVTG